MSLNKGICSSKGHTKFRNSYPSHRAVATAEFPQHLCQVRVARVHREAVEERFRVRGWFTWETDTAELKEEKALLNEAA